MEQDVCEEDPSARKESGNIHPYNYSKSADQKVADIELANRVYQQHLRLMEENARLAKHGITSHSSVNIDKE